MIEVTSINQAQELVNKYKDNFFALENNRFHAFLVSPTAKVNGINWMVFFKDSKQTEPRKTIIQFISKSRAEKIAKSLNTALLESKVR